MMKRVDTDMAIAVAKIVACALGMLACLVLEVRAAQVVFGLPLLQAYYAVTGAASIALFVIIALLLVA